MTDRIAMRIVVFILSLLAVQFVCGQAGRAVALELAARAP